MISKCTMSMPLFKEADALNKAKEAEGSNSA
jgi:hypothetical protein